MTLQNTARPRGQVKIGASTRSADLLIPVKARRLIPGFWGCPEKFTADPKIKTKKDRPVKIRLDEAVHEAKMMFWPEKDELCLRSEEIRSAIQSDSDLLLVMTTEEEAVPYEIAVIHADDKNYSRLLGFCLMQTEGKKSKKLFGYLDDNFEPINPPREFWALVLHRPEGPRFSLFTDKEKKRASDELKSLERIQYPSELIHLVEQFD